MQRVVIAGGGTAGWMAAAALAKVFGRALDITVVESDEIGTVGVGEATIPTLRNLHGRLGVDEQAFMRAVQGTFKLGIRFEDWGNVGTAFVHAFGTTGQDNWMAGFHHYWLKGRQLGISRDFGAYSKECEAAHQGRFAVPPYRGLTYAYHMDASLYARFLRGLAEEQGAVRQEGRIAHVELDPSSGLIAALRLESGQRIEGDLFIDCTGFRGLLIEQALKVGYDDWGHCFPCDSAVAVQSESVGPPTPYTRAIARGAGWQWRIPLQHRVGNGMVFSSAHWSDDEALARLLAGVDGKPLSEPRVIRFQAGQRRKHWHGNCVAMGLASGFIEPLESTSIHLIQRSVLRLIRLFPRHGIRQPDVTEFNRQMQLEILSIRDFLLLHYQATKRADSAFWRDCRNLEVPDSLKHRIELFRQGGNVFQVSSELFGEPSWIQVMLGLGVMPKQHHPIADKMSDGELASYLADIRDAVERYVGRLPEHQAFIDRYCKAVPRPQSG